MTLSTEQEERLKTLVRIFLEENKNINLSAYRTEEQCWVGNVLDSVAAEKIIEGCASRPFVGAQDRLSARHAEEAGALRLVQPCHPEEHGAKRSASRRIRLGLLSRTLHS